MTFQDFPNIHFSGAGIVCGLELRRREEAGIALTPGYGVSSAGKWIAQENFSEFYYYRQLRKEGEEAVFGYFKDPPVIYELLSTHQCGSETEDFSWILRQSPSDESYLELDDKIVVLFLDETDQKRILAFHREHLAAYLYGTIPWETIPAGRRADATGFSLFQPSASEKPADRVSNYALYNFLHPVMRLPVLRIRRFGYADIDVENLPCDENYLPSFCNPGIKIFQEFRNEYAKLVNHAFAQLEGALAMLDEYKGEWLDAEEIAILRAQFQALYVRWEAYQRLPELILLPAKVPTPDQSGIQYWYDLLRDLFDAWNELREAILGYGAVGFFKTEAFPRHLVLGGVPEEREPFYHDPFRTVFRQPPVFNNQAELSRRLRFLHWRLVIMMKSFFVPGTDWDDTATDSYLEPSTDIGADNPSNPRIILPLRLTPSPDPAQPLGKRAIPFYYDLADHPQSLHWYWDYNAAFCNRTDLHLSYHADNDTEAVKKVRGDIYAGLEVDVYSNRAETIHPFTHDLRGMPFIRVEGIVGKNPDKVAAGLDSLKEKYHIDFKVAYLFLPPNQDGTLCRRYAEHLGGVYQKGTLVLVIASNPQQGSKIVGDFCI